MCLAILSASALTASLSATVNGVLTAITSASKAALSAFNCVTVLRLSTNALASANALSNASEVYTPSLRESTNEPLRIVESAGFSFVSIKASL